MATRPEAPGKPREFAILDSLGLGVLLLDAERRVLFLNRHARQMLEVSEEELLGENLSEYWELVVPGGQAALPGHPSQ